MGFIDLVNGFFRSFGDFASSSTEFKCSQCIKCKKSIRTLSNGKQIRLFTCPAVDSNVCYDNSYIDDLVPSVSNGISTEYLEKYNEHREEIYKYLCNSSEIYEEAALPLSDRFCEPIKSLNELQNFYKATECPNFRPFINTSNILTDNEFLYKSSYPDLQNFDDLSQQDKMRITHRYDW